MHTATDSPGSLTSIVSGSRESRSTVEPIIEDGGSSTDVAAIGAGSPHQSWNRGCGGAVGAMHDWIEKLASSSGKTITIAATAAVAFTALAITAVTNTAALLPFDHAAQAWITEKILNPNAE